MEVVATAPFAATFVTAPASFATNPLKVPATTSANAATTRIQNSQQNKRNNFFPKLSDIRFDDISDRTSFILYGCIHGCKILHSSEKYTTDEDP